MNKKNWLIIGLVVLVALGIWFYFDSPINVKLSEFGTNPLSGNGVTCLGNGECESGRCNSCYRCQAKEPDELDGDLGSSCMRNEDCGEYSCFSGSRSSTLCCVPKEGSGVKVCTKYKNCEVRSFEVIK